MLKKTLIEIYRWMSRENNIEIVRKIDRLLRVLGGPLYVRTLGQLKYKLRFSKVLNQDEGILCARLEWEYEKKMLPQADLKVSILLSDNSRADNKIFIRNQIDKQCYKNFEVIIVPARLDDFVSFIMKGIQLSKGDLLWIPNCKMAYGENFLTEMVDVFAYRSVMLAVCKGNYHQWDGNFYMSSTNYVEYLFENKYLEADLESKIFRNPKLISKEFLFYSDISSKLVRFMWLLDLIRGGVVGYTSETEICRKDNYDGHENIMLSEIDVAKNFISQRYRLQEENTVYIKEQKKKLNIAMLCYALKSGGGETFPIYLAKELRQKGHTVTIINLGLEDSEKEIIDLIPPSIPVVNIRHTDVLGEVFLNLGVDIIHSHNAVADYSAALWIAKYPLLGRHIITLHGMYEAINKVDCNRVIAATYGEVYKYVYIADKNLDCFIKRKQFVASKFVKISNGLPRKQIQPLERKKMGVDENDFVCILASRGIVEKGWREAIEAVKKANMRSRRKIQLFILGDGPVRKHLEKLSLPYVHFMGTVSNTQKYFAMGDVGLLPTYYKGESYPIVVMECLMAGTPVIATDIAEISNQIRNEQGESAGLLVPLRHQKVSADDICQALLEMVNDQKLYEKMRKNTASVCKKFSMDKVCQAYLNVYQEAYKEKKSE